MKGKTYFAYAALAGFLTIAGCSAQKQSAVGTAGQEAAAKRGNFVGTWTLNSVNMQNLPPNAKVKNVFDTAPANDFNSSVWILTNSGKGKFTLSGGTEQSLFWSYDNKTNIFGFKKLAEGDKPQNVSAGYQLNVVSNDGTNLVMRSPIELDGKQGYIEYAFTKTGKAY
ncbi:MAG: hypothetical protein INR69_04630 [Mucilaginibacter polytrichastri]|nr:hypothetical protein [Mucilaginibacter polytrichastri]